MSIGVKVDFDISGMKRRADEALAEFRRVNQGALNATQEISLGSRAAVKAMANAIHSTISTVSDQISVLSRKILEQKDVIKNVEADVSKRRLTWQNATSASGKNEAWREYQASRKALNEEKAALFGLQQEQSRAKLKNKDLTDQLKKYESQIQKNNSVTSQFTRLLGLVGGTYVFSSIGRQVVEVTGQFQMLNVAFKTILQSKEKATALMAQIVETAKTTPFQLTELATGAKQLVAYGFTAEETNGTLLKLGNVAAALNLPLERLTYLYGTTRTQGRLYARDMIQFTTSGIPLLDELAKMYGKTTQEVNKMVSAGKIGFPEVQRAFDQMTGKGGKFYNLMQESSKTVTGQISNLKDSFTIMLAELGQGNVGIMNAGISGAKALVDNYKTVGKIIIDLVAIYGTYKTALIVVTTLEGVMNTNAVSRILLLRRLATAQAALNSVMMINPYVAIATVLIGLVATMAIFYDRTSAQEKAQKKLNETLKEAKDYKEQMQTQSQNLINTIRSETSTVYEQVKAWDELIKKYKFFSKYSIEDIRKMSDKDIAKLLSEASTTSQDDFLKNSYQSKKKEVTDLEKLIKETEGDIANGMGGKSAYTKLDRYKLSLKEARLEVLLFEKELINIDRQKRDASVQSLPQSEQKAYWDQQIKNLTRLKELTANDSLMSTANKDAAIKRINEQIESAKKSYSAFRDDETKKNHDYWKKIRDDAQAELDLLGSGQKGSAKWKELSATIANANSEIAKYTVEKTSKNAIDQLDTFNEKVKAANLALAQSSIDIMKDGKAKELAILDQKLGEQLLSIEKEQSDLISLSRKTNQKVTKDQFDEFETRRTNLKNATKREKDEVEKKYSTEIANVYTQLSGVFQTEEQKKRAEIEETYREMLKWAKKTYEGGGMSKTEFMKISGEIDRAKNRALLADSLKDFATYQTKKKLIEERYNTQIENLRKNGYEAEAKNAEGARDAALLELKISQESFYQVLFGDLQKYSISQINEAIIKAKALIDQYTNDAKQSGKKLTPEELKAIESLLNAISKGSKEPQERLTKIVQSIDALAKAGVTLGGVLGQIFEVVGGVTSNLSNLFTVLDKNSSKTDKISAGISSVATIFSMIGNQIAENKRKQEEWNASIAEAAHQAALARIELDAYKESNLFGVENPYAKAIAGAKQYSTAMIELQSAALKLGAGQVQVGTKKAVSGSNIAIGASSGAGAGAAIGSIVPVIGTAIGAVVGGIVGAIAGLFTRKTVPVFESLKKKYGEIYNSETFELNPKIIADYKKLDDETKKLVDNWKEIKDKALEAQEAMRENFKDLAGEMGTQLSDALINAFKNGNIYDAVDSYKEYVSGAIGDILAQLIFSAKFQDLFDQLEKKFNDSFGSNGDMSIIDDMEWFLGVYSSQIDGYNQAMKDAQEAFKNKGIDLWKNDSTRTGITKGIAQASQDSVDMLGGLATTISEHTYIIKNDIATLVSQGAAALNYLNKIEKNTARLEAIEQSMSSMSKNIDNIILKGVKIQ